MFLSLLQQIIPLISLSLIGYIAGRSFKLHPSELGTMVAFILAPLVSIGAILKSELSFTYMMLIPLGFVMSACVTLLTYTIGRMVFKNNLANTAALNSSSGNTAFFGLPIFMTIAPQSMVGAYLMVNLGLTLCASSLGYYLAAKGQYTAKESLIKLLKTPPVHAIWIGLVMNLCGITASPIVMTYWDKVLDSWIVIGMMLIGIALAACPRISVDVKLCLYMNFVRFGIWAFVTLGFVFMDMMFFHVFSEGVRLILLVMGFVPMAVSSVAVTSTLGLHTDKIAFALLCTTLLAVVVTPLAITFFLPYLQ